MTPPPASSTTVHAASAPGPHDLPDVFRMVLGVLGGTGPQGAHQVESLVADLISVNRRYTAHAGPRVTGI
jgi:hypothetical protein